MQQSCESLPALGSPGFDMGQPSVGTWVNSPLAVTTNYKKRAVIAFDVDAKLVSIIDVFYGGQDFETVLQSDLDEMGTDNDD